MASLLTYLGFNRTAFSKGLDQAVQETKKAGGSIESNLVGALKGSSIFQAIVSPIGLATTALAGFVAYAGAKFRELLEQAKEVKAGASESNLDPQQYQKIMLAAQAAGQPVEWIAKGVTKIAEAQEKIVKHKEGAAKALEAFGALGFGYEEIAKSSYQDLFMKLAERMDVNKLSAEQLASGVELLGKAFESLEASAKKLNDPMAQMGQLTDDELNKLNQTGKGIQAMKKGTDAGIKGLLMDAAKYSPGVIGGAAFYAMAKGQSIEDREARQRERRAQQERENEDLAQIAKQENEATLRKLKAAEEDAKDWVEIMTHDQGQGKSKKAKEEKFKLERGTALNSQQEIGGWIAANSMNTIADQHLQEAKVQTLIMRDIHAALVRGGGTVDSTGRVISVNGF